MEIIVELLCNFFGEFLLQIGIELILEVGLRKLSEASDVEECKPIFSFFGYGLLGLAAGGLSLLLFPHALVRSSRFHGISLIIVPVLAGLAMSGVGYLRKKQGKAVIRIDSFLYGFIFAFGMALIRLLFTK